MGEVAFTEIAIKEMMERLKNIEASIKAKQFNNDDVFLDNHEFLQVMYISKRTAAEWRSQRLITYSQVGGKIYYKASDILEMLERFSVPAIIKNKSVNNSKNLNHVK
jgi:hypothetical protein